MGSGNHRGFYSASDRGVSIGNRGVGVVPLGQGSGYYNTLSIGGVIPIAHRDLSTRDGMPIALHPEGDAVGFYPRKGCREGAILATAVSVRCGLVEPLSLHCTKR